MTLLLMPKRKFMDENCNKWRLGFRYMSAKHYVTTQTALCRVLCHDGLSGILLHFHECYIQNNFLTNIKLLTRL